jgi:UDP-2,3-diacylglucosamine pyrophosphatase LpxH
MIVFISDLHLTDGTFDYRDTGNPQTKVIPHDISAEAFQLFWEDIRRIAYANPEARVKEITVVLLGDIFEMRSTTQWVASDYDKTSGNRKGLGDRTWKEDRAKPTQTCIDVLDAILKNNKESLDYLTTKNLVRLDKESALNKFHSEGVTFKFKYVIGNHDSLIIFHQDDVLRNMIKNQLGWEIVPEASPGSPLGTRFVFDDLGVVAEHGHRGDFVDYYNNNYYDPPLGALLPDTFGRLMYHIQRIPASKEQIKKELVIIGMNIDNVRPSTDGLDWLLASIPKDPAARKELRAVLTIGLEELIADGDPLFSFIYPRIKDRLKNIPWYIKAGLAIAAIFKSKEKIIKDMLLKTLGKIVDRLKKDEATDPLDKVLDELKDKVNGMMPKGEAEKKPYYYDNARHEADRPESKFIVYGHTHQFEIVPLRTIGAKKAFYFNSGTWKKTIQKNLYCPDCLDFQQWARMTYLNIYDVANKENKDHVFDLWHGNLQFKDDV